MGIKNTVRKNIFTTAFTAAASFGSILIIAQGCAPDLKQYFTPVWNLSNLPSAPVPGTKVAPSPSPSASASPSPSSTVSPSPSPSASASPSPSPSTVVSPTPTSTPNPSPSPSSSPYPTCSPSPAPTVAPSDPWEDDGDEVCDGFGDREGDPGVGWNYGHGLTARVEVLPAKSPVYKSVYDAEAVGVPLAKLFYFSQLNTPTEDFVQGFQTKGNVVITNPDGTPLIENFTIRFDSQLLLPSDDDGRMYQFALLADDGAVLKIDQGSGYQVAVNDDGAHPTKMACSTTPVFVGSKQSLPIQVDYYQGQGYHVALMLLFREWTVNGSKTFSPNDPLCGASGDNLFFDPTTNPPKPQPAYQDLLSRGWNVVPAGHFYLPGRPPKNNPCH